MMVFGGGSTPEPELSDAEVTAALAAVKRNARHRRVVLVAPLALAAAVLGAFVAGPPQDGGLTLVPDAAAADEVQLPRVYGANGVWRVPEPIGDTTASLAGPPSIFAVPNEPAEPVFSLDGPSTVETTASDTQTSQSLSASASSPPTPTLGQSAANAGDRDLSPFQPDIRLVAPAPASAPDTGETPVENASDEESAPVASEQSELDTAPTSSSPDEDVSTAEPAPPGQAAAPIGESAESPNATDAVAGDPSEANPSSPQVDSPVRGTMQPESTVAVIVPRSVLVHRAHVSVTVQVVDDDSSVIDWCNTRVDWGDGSVTGWADPDGVAACTATCERAAAPSGLGINAEVTFTHEYATFIDASPRVFIATGDGCNYSLAEYQLGPFTVAPY